MEERKKALIDNIDLYKYMSNIQDLKKQLNRLNQ